MSRRAALLAGAALAGACHVLADAPGDGPAVLRAPDPAARAELVAAVTRALGAATPVRLADDALVSSSQLIIERAALPDPEGHPADGRVRGRPEHFELRLRDGHCELLHVGGGRVRLAHATCAPAPH